eukprot:scaffold49924_cov59-Attheya_sp.AAC.1
MGNIIVTATQNTCLAEGFFILRIGRVDKTVLPQTITEFHEMRKLSNMSTQSFDFDGSEGHLSNSDEDFYDTQSHSNHIAIDNCIAIDNTQHMERSSGVVNHTDNAQDDTQVSEALPSGNCSYLINDDATDESSKRITYLRMMTMKQQHS